MNKVSAVAFVIVLLFVGIAGYLVYSNIRDDLPRIKVVMPEKEPSPTAVVVAETVVTQPEATPTGTPLPTATPAPTQPAPTATGTFTPIVPTATPTRSAGSTIQVVTPTTSPTLTPRVSGTTTVTATPTGEAPGRPTGAPTATRRPAGNFTFYLDGDVIHDLDSSCVAQYIRGMVRDKSGDPLEGVRLKAFDLWGNEVMSISKGGADIGKWDIVLGGTENVWKVVVLNEAGVEISPIAVVPHHQDDDFKSACVHVVDWRRAW